jgi:hypothetical protein
MPMKKSCGFESNAISPLANQVDLKTTAEIDVSLIARYLEQQTMKKVWVEWVGKVETDPAGARWETDQGSE